MSVSTYDVVIAGAGIVGAACACEFAAAGLRTAVVEGDMVGSGATAAGMGHIVVMDDSEAQLALGRYSQQLWNELSPQLPEDCEHRVCGTLWLAADEEEWVEAQRKRQTYALHGLKAELLDARSLAQAEPALRSGLAGALRVEGDSVLYPPGAARFLIERAQHKGAVLMSGRVVSEMTGQRVRLADGETFSAASTVNAAGHGASRLTPPLQGCIRPRKGHLAITDRYPGLLRHQLVELGYLKTAHSSQEDSVAFNLQPRATGQLLVGSSRQFDVEDLSVEPPILGRMLRRACRYLPQLAELSVIRAWTGLRVATPDHLPLIGPWPDEPGLFLAAGHEGLGISHSLGTARLLADQILGRTPAIPHEPYLPSRLLQGAPHG